MADIETILKEKFGMEFTEPKGSPPTFQAKSSTLIMNDLREQRFRDYGFTFDKAAAGNKAPFLQAADYARVHENLIGLARGGYLYIRTKGKSSMKSVSLNEVTEEVSP